MSLGAHFGGDANELIFFFAKRSDRALGPRHNFTGSGTATFNLVGKVTSAAITVQKTGTSMLTINPGANTDAFSTLQANGGTLNLSGGTINLTQLQVTPASGISSILNMTAGTVTVTYNGQVSVSFPIVIAVSNAALFTLDSTGNGPAIACRASRRQSCW